jgi:hypothetical protein
MPTSSSFLSNSNTAKQNCNNNNDVNKNNKVKLLELDSSNMIIARKLSGRMTNLAKHANNNNKKAQIINSTNSNLESPLKSENDNQNALNVLSSKNCSICLVSFDDESEIELNLIENMPPRSKLSAAAADKEDESSKISASSQTQSTSQSNQLVQILCGHTFCRDCWQTYLTMKIDEGNVVDILCPQVDCYAILPHDVVERLVSKETAMKYSQFDLKAFVDSNPSIKWCPYPGCVMAVRDPKLSASNQNSLLLFDINNNNNNEKEKKDKTGHNDSISGVDIDLIDSKKDLTQSDQNSDYSRSVDCGAGHYFCW